MLPMLLDKFRMHLLVLSEDLTYHFKYLQVVQGRAAPHFDDGEGNIAKAKYIYIKLTRRLMAWWQMGLEDTLKMIEADSLSFPPEEKQPQ